MKITCTTEHLKIVILNAERFTSKQVTLPILADILFKVDEKNITINATNLEFGIQITIPGKIIKEGKASIPAKILSSFIQLLPETTITLEEKNNLLNIHTADSEITIPTHSTDDFPTFPTIKSERVFKVPTEALNQALPIVIKSVSLSDFKPELSGVFVVFNQEIITLVGTDSFRLAEKILPIENSIPEHYECIIPSRTSQELIRILPSNPNSEMNIVVGENQALFSWPGVKIISRLVDGAYPPYQNIIPKAFETTIMVKKDELISKIRLASIFSSRLNDVTLTYNDNSLEISTNHPELGRSSSRIPSKTKGKTGSSVFNFKYLLDGVEALAGDNVNLHISSATGPALVQDPEDKYFRYLLMPIRPI